MIYKMKTRKYGRKYKRPMRGGDSDDANKFLAITGYGVLVIGVLTFYLFYFSKGGHSGSKSL
jgi:hypothetical protein